MAYPLAWISTEAVRHAGYGRRLAILLGLIAVFACPSLGWAQLNTWTNAANSNWNLVTNWSGGVPTSSSDVVINNNISINQDVNSTINSLTVGGSATKIVGSTSNNNITAAFTLTLTNGFTHTNNTSASFFRIDTLALGTNQTWSLNGPTGTNSASSSGFTLARQTGTPLRNNLGLAGYTLTKQGSGQLSLGNMTVGNGSIDIEEGSVRFGTGIMASSTNISVQVIGTGTIAVKDGAALMFSSASDSGTAGSFDVTKAIRMEGTAENPSILHYTGVISSNNNVNKPLIASPIEWTGVTNAVSYWVNDTGITGTQNPWTFSGDWTGSGTVQLVTDKAAGTQAAGRITVFSGSNAGFSGLVDNQQSDGFSTVRFGSANAGSGNAEWRLSNTNAGYQLNGFNVALGALSGTAGALSNGSASAATVTIGGKGIDSTFGGLLTNGSTGALAVTKVGSGRLTLSNTNTYTGATAVNEGILAVNGSIAVSSGVSVAAGATLTGSGLVATLSGAGLVSPGSSPGILTAPSIDPGDGMDFAFELTGTGSPNYGTATASVNDVLRLTGATPSLGALDVNNVVSVYFGGTLSVGDTFRGGTYVDVATTPEIRDTFAAAIAGADWRYFVQGDGGGTNFFNGTGYYTLAQYDPSLSIDLAVVADTADFASGSVSGAITQFTVVPEPGGLGLAAVAAGFAAWRLRRRKGRAA